MSSEYAITVSELGKCYEIYDAPRDRLKQALIPPLARALGFAGDDYFRKFWALRNINFSVKKGETFGIIGRNGSGKSTLLQIIAGIISPTEGYVNVTGRIAALLELGSGFNPDFTGRENVFMNGQILGLTASEIAARYEEIAAFADIGDFINQPVKTYSSGMFLRLAFAVQAHIDASIVIVDEALAVGDVFFRQKCYARMEKLKQSGAAILLVSHSMPDIEQYCDRALLLNNGEGIYLGSASVAAKHYYMAGQSIGSIAPEISKANSAILQPSLVDRLEAPEGSSVGDGRVRCMGISVEDADGQRCRSFFQGDTATFVHAYSIIDRVPVPIGGLIIVNDKGVIVHGKNAWQFPGELPENLAPGCQVLFEHKVQLNLQPGEYTFEFGFASVPIELWRMRDQMSFDDWNTGHETLSVLTHAGAFSIALAKSNGHSILTHHGIADLPGHMKTQIVSGN